ncbi:MAG: hypothetical protein ABI206_12660 [Antricoccus sp.]
MAELGRIAKTRDLMACLDDDSYRRRILTQLRPHRRPPSPCTEHLPRTPRAASPTLSRRARRPTRRPPDSSSTRSCCETPNIRTPPSRNSERKECRLTKTT